MNDATGAPTSTATDLALPDLAAMSPLDQALLGYLSRYEGRTRTQYEYQLRRWLEWCADHGLDPMAVQRTHLELYVRWLSERRGCKPSTVGSTVSPVMGLYRFAHVDGLLGSDPAAHIRLPKVRYDKKVPLDREELRQIRRAGKQLGGRHWAAAELLVVHALRASEIAEAQVSDMRDVERGHHVLRFKRKGGRTETIPLPVGVLLALEAAAGDRETGPIITARDGVSSIGRSGVAQLLRTLIRHTSIDRQINPHLVRASCITAALDQGMPIRDAQHLAGHLDPRTTATYDLGLHNHDNHPAHLMAARLTAA